jgi:hypothetical protein
LIITILICIQEFENVNEELMFQYNLFKLTDVSLQVETFGAMAKTEKLAFILEQVRHT